MPVFEDWLNDPVSIINNIFASDPVNFDQKVKEYFDGKLKSEKNYYTIPCLNEVQIHDLKPNCLVRYRCMIQDSFDPIYYASVQKLKNTATSEICQMTFKYKEHLEIPEGFENCHDDEIQQENLKPDASLENAMDIHFSKKNQVDLQQRMTFYCVPIPGESEWVKNVYKANSPQSVNNSLGSSSNTSHRPSKRTIDSGNDNNEENITDSCLSEVTNNKTEEESKLNNITDNVLTAPVADKCKVCSKSKVSQKNSTKKTKVEECGDKKINSNNVNNLNFPLHLNETGHACLVKAYDDLDNFKINDMVEFIGILSQEPSLAYEHDEHTDTQHQNFQMSEKLMSKVTLEENSMETDDSCETCRCNDSEKKRQNLQVLSSYPPSLVPRLHCIKSQHLIHNNPFLYKEKSENESQKSEEVPYWSKQYKMFLSSLIEGQSFGTKTSPTTDAVLFENAKSKVLNLRQEIVNCFQEMLLGDALAAEYLLMHLLSTIFMRKDVTVLGKFSLNLMNIPMSVKSSQNENSENKESKMVPETFSTLFYKALSQFVTMSHCFKLTIDNLNKSNMIPCKDYNKNKLITGMLQLPDNFQFVIDETNLSAGELNAKGLMNFNSIKGIIETQRLGYDFNYHHQEFETKLRILTLSESKSILPSDVAIKIQSKIEKFDSSSYDNVIFNLFGKKDSALLNNFRNYLTILSNLEYTIPENVQKIVEEDIVNIRKEFIASSSNKTNATSKEKVIDIDAIHNILIVARLQSLSYGNNELTINEWNTAKTLEFERLHNRV